MSRARAQLLDLLNLTVTMSANSRPSTSASSGASTTEGDKESGASETESESYSGIHGYSDKVGRG